MKYGTPQWMIEQGFSPTLAERFWRKVVKTDACWIWTAYRNIHGYGGINSVGRMFLANRISWMLHRGPIPEGFDVCHDCPGGDNPSCVRPDHLWLGTAQQNMKDASKKGRLRNRPILTGEKSPHHKLTQEQVDELRRLWSTHKHITLASHFGITYTHAHRICSGGLWA